MPGVKKGAILDCNTLFVIFYDQCQDPPIATDPYVVYYSISTVCDLSKQETVLTETIDSEPLRSEAGKYYVPQLPTDLEPGRYKVRWKFKEREDCTWKEICMEFVLYSAVGCQPIQTFSNSCICF